MNENPFAAPRFQNREKVSSPTTAKWPKWLNYTVRYGLLLVYALIWAVVTPVAMISLLGVGQYLAEVLGMKISPPSSFAGVRLDGEFLLGVAFWLFGFLGLVLGWATRKSRRWHRFATVFGMISVIPLGTACVWHYASPRPTDWGAALGHDILMAVLVVWTLATGFILLSGLLGWVIRRTYDGSAPSEPPP